MNQLPKVRTVVRGRELITPPYSILHDILKQSDSYLTEEIFMKRSMMEAYVKGSKVLFPLSSC